MSRTRILLADDHETVRQGLRLLLDAQPDMEVVAEAGDGRAALALAGETQPDVVVLDISMPTLNGLEAARRLKDVCPGGAIVALTRHGETAYVRELIAAGAAGYVLKQSSSQQLLNAIRAVAAGKPYVDPTLSEVLPQRDRRPRSAPALTPRESEVIRMMALGLSNKEIASAMQISVKTVEVHKTNGMRKMGFQGRIDVMRYAMLQGWLLDG